MQANHAWHDSNAWDSFRKKLARKKRKKNLVFRK